MYNCELFCQIELCNKINEGENLIEFIKAKCSKKQLDESAQIL